MSHYKLTYFPIRGKAEAIRMVFSIAGVEFKDVRVTQHEWFTKLNDSEYSSKYLSLSRLSLDVL